MNTNQEIITKVAAEGAVVELVINRPCALNALNSEMLRSLLACFESLNARPDLRAVIVTGEGTRSFVAGADVEYMSGLDAGGIAEFADLGQRTMRSIETIRVPVIAAVNGFALGGGLELALACDLIVAASNARVGQPEVNLGIIPVFGGTQRLIERCGLGTARRLVLTGEIIDADEALKLGIVDKVVDPAELMNVAHAWGELIASKGPLAIAAAKKVMRQYNETALVSGLRREVSSFLEVFASKDCAEGMSAFAQKRPAAFNGK